ncbi:MAG: hypothetical protein JST89_07085 [Cyanobacteria bacterium SZAS-4]|nr:hypothetical protein [Cyanobacteria bacterium SZAS-4]
MTTRRNNGFSLVTVLSLGLISTMMLFAVTASILPLYQKASQNVPYIQLRNSAESAVNAVVGDLNNTLTTSQTSTYDATTFGVTRVTTVIGSPAVQITVENIAPAAGDFLYNSAFDFSPSKPFSSASLYTSNPWRMVEVISSFDKTQPPQVMARSLIRRTISAPSSANSPAFSTSTSNTTEAVFKYALFAAQSLTAQNASIKGTNNFDGDLGTNGTATLLGGVDVDGSLTVGSATDSTSRGMNVATGNDSTTIHDQLLVNGKYSGFSAGDNVLGQGPGNSANPIVNSADSNRLPATPSAPTSANSLGDLNFQNGGSILFQNNVAFPPSASALATFASGGQLKLPPGDYAVNSLNTSTGSISMDSSLSLPVRLFINGDSSSAVNITGAGVRNNTNVASNLQIYYAGSSNVNLTSTGFTGVVYAPGASVVISKANVHGSVVGNNISVSRASVNFDSTLTDVGYQANSSNSRPNYTPASNLTFDKALYNAAPFASLSCQEINNPR